MTFSPKIMSTRELRSFKRRGKKSFKKLNLIFGDSLIFFKKEGSVESIYFKFLKKFLKNFLKKKITKYSFLRKKIWFFIHSNFPLTKKSKNARMGKGKGGFVRWSVRVKQYSKLFETKNISSYQIKILIKKVQFRLNIKLGFLKKQKKIIKVVNYNKYSWYI